MAKPKRTFSANVGQKSIGIAGPDQIEHDLDNLAATLDPTDQLRDGTPGGLGEENLKAGSIGDNSLGNRTVNQNLAGSSNTGTITQLLSWCVREIKGIKGAVTNWYDSAVVSISAIWEKFNSTTGHTHTGGVNDAPRIDHSSLLNKGTVTHEQLDTHVNALAPHAGHLTEASMTTAFDAHKIRASVATILDLPVGDPVGIIRIVVDDGTGKPNIYKHNGGGLWVVYGSESITNHGQLIGLLNDDHPQYALDTDLRAYATVVVAANNSVHKAKADFVVPDGADNAQVTIQAAINSLPANGGRIVLLEGTYIISGAINPRSKVTIEGQGKDLTIIKLRDNHNANVPAFSLSVLGDLIDFAVLNLTLDGNKYAQISGTNNGVYFVGPILDNIVFDNCRIHNWRNNGLLIYVSGTNLTNRVTINNCEALNNNGVGIYLHQCTSIITNNRIQGNTSHGLNIYGGTNRFGIVEGNIITHNTLNGFQGYRLQLYTITTNVCCNNGYAGLNISGSNAIATVITNNTCSFNGMYGIWITDWIGCVLSNNICMGNSQLLNATYDNIHITCDFENTVVGYNSNIITNNVCRIGWDMDANIALTKKPRYGIYIQSRNSDLVFNNDCLNSGVIGDISNTGLPSWNRTKEVPLPFNAQNVFRTQNKLSKGIIEKYDALTNMPATISFGGTSAYDGKESIYVLRGGSSLSFYCYNITGNSWNTLNNTSATIGAGASLAYTGGNYLYALSGNNSQIFMRYNIQNNSWDIMADIPLAVSNGGSLVYTGDKYIYAFCGNNSTSFYRYNIDLNVWDTMTAAPQTVDYGGGLVYTNNDFIYALRGNSTTFWRYSISKNSWEVMASIPATVSYGASLTYPGGDYIIALRGSSTDVYKYNILTNTWTTLLNTLDIVGSEGNKIVFAGEHFYIIRGNDTSTFWRATLAEKWSPHPYEIPATVNQLINLGTNVKSIIPLRVGSSGRYYCCGLDAGTALTTGAPTANVLRAMPLIIANPEGRVVTDIAINVTTGVTGVARLGIYADDGNLHPSNLIIDAGEIITTSTGVQARTLLDVYLPPGVYWVVLVSNAAPTIRAMPVASTEPILGYDNTLGTAAGFGWSVNFTYGTLPTTFPAATAITAVPIPAIFVRFLR